MEENIKNNKRKTLIMGIVGALLLVVGTTYAFFSYYSGSSAFVLTTNGISALFTAGSNAINMSNMYPISDEYAMDNLARLDYVDFTVSGNVDNSDEAIDYEIYLTEKNGNTLSSDYVKVLLTDNLNNLITEPKIYSSLDYTTYVADSSNGKVVYIGHGSGNFTKSYRLYAWIDKDYTQNTVSQTFSFYVNLYAHNGENRLGTYLLQKSIDEKEDNSCITYVEDYDTNENLEATYLSGDRTGDCAVDFNYVWYSGKMWKITAIYPDGSMKLMTDKIITTIAFSGSSSTFYDKSTGAKSYAFQWLNEDFLDTLVDYKQVIDTTSKYWNIATIANVSTSSVDKPTEADATMIPTSIAPVGMLNMYEVYKIFENKSAGGSINKGHAMVRYDWFSITPQNASYIRVVSSSFSSFTTNYSATNQRGIRPAIYLKPGISFTSGDGSYDNPYVIETEHYKVGKSNEALNKRVSGEYIKFSSDNNAPMFRIIDIENNTTKIVSLNYASSTDGNTTTTIKKMFASTSKYGASGNTESDDYWDYYLNHTWYNNLSFKDKLARGIYYTGGYVSSGQSYKQSVCVTPIANGETIKSCSNKNSVWTTNWNNGNTYVGLFRMGEMFAAQQEMQTSTGAETIWLLTDYNGTNVDTVTSGNQGANGNPNANSYAVYPTYNLKSDVRIVSGSGTPTDPYIVS